jgi:hydrogenase maturation protease
MKGKKLSPGRQAHGGGEGAMTQRGPVPKILVAGIGNILLQDDGFGPQAIDRLESTYEFDSEVELLDLGTPTLDFVDYLAGRELVIVLDAVAGGGEPGEVLTFNREQLRQQLPNMRLSAHQPCLQETLYIAETTGIELKEIFLIGVVGYSFDVGTQLGPYVSAAMPQALNIVLEVLSRYGIGARRRQHPLHREAWWKRESVLPDR